MVALAVVAVAVVDVVDVVVVVVAVRWCLHFSGARRQKAETGPTLAPMG
jgi:hypothetical protein